MDGDRDLTDDLEQLQSNISNLFKSVIKDKNKYKYERDKSVASMDSLIKEITILRQENEQLRKGNNMKNSCMTCSELKEQLIVQDMRSKKLEKSLEVLRELLSNVPYKDGILNFSKIIPRKLDKLRNDNHQVTDEKSGGCSLTSPNNTYTDEDELIIYDTFYEKTNPPNHTASHGTNGEENKHVNSVTPTQGEESYLDLIPSGAVSKANFELIDAEFRTPKKLNKSEVDFNTSPSSFGNRIKNGEKSPILVDQRLLVNRNTFPGSPSLLKRKANDTLSESPGKLSNKTLFPKSPKMRKYKSPVKGSRMKSTSQLKSTNSIEAEISLAGVRKLKQTQLNPDYYKSKSQDVGSNATGCNAKVNDENKFAEDDLILESPKHSFNFYDEFKKNFRREEPVEEETANDGLGPKPEVFDPEETFVSSTFIRNNLKDAKQPEQENRILSKERSPEYNTVPYPYKGSPVRKKAERMRLPGHTCMECNKYYEAILGEIDPKKLQEILNQCSKHRDQHYNIVETPPGYWKPYLTATMDGSAGDDDDTQLDE